MENQNTSAHWYNKTWLVIILCIFFFPVGLYALWKNATISKGWKIVVTTIVAIVVIAQIGSDKKVIEGNTSVSSDDQAKTVNKTWTKVFSFKGNGMKKSQLFELTGNPARASYNYKSEDPTVGMFAMYVVDEGMDIMKDGGIPDVMINKSEKSETSIQKTQGKYYLNVNSTGDWEVTVEEEK